MLQINDIYENIHTGNLYRVTGISGVTAGPIVGIRLERCFDNTEKIVVSRFALDSLYTIYKTVTVPLNHFQNFTTRMDVNQSARTALLNYVKDYTRATYYIMLEEGTLNIEKMHEITELAYYHLKTLITGNKSRLSYSVRYETLDITVQQLTPIGLYLDKVMQFYKDMTPKQYEKFLGETLKSLQ